MTQEKDPVAELMRLADEYAESRHTKGDRSYNDATRGAYRALEAHARTMAARIAELEHQLEAVGAGSVIDRALIQRLSDALDDGDAHTPQCSTNFWTDKPCDCGKAVLLTEVAALAAAPKPPTPEPIADYRLGKTPTFTRVAAGKLAELKAQGYQISGYSFERTAGDTVTCGFITHGGLVGWWIPRSPLCDEHIDGLGYVHGVPPGKRNDFARAIEKAHKIG